MSIRFILRSIVDNANADQGTEIIGPDHGHLQPDNVSVHRR